MSAVSGVGSSGVDLYQWLQQVGQSATANASANASTTSAASTATAASTAANAEDPTQTDPSASSGTQGAGHHHHHHGFGSKIESAVTSALQSAPSGSDPNEVVKDAITQALKDGGNGATPGGTNPDAAGNGTPGGGSGTTAAGSSSGSSFAQLLQSYGIDSTQFQQDLQGAVSGQQQADGSSGTGVDFAKLFKSFPPGSLLQATG